MRRSQASVVLQLPSRETLETIVPMLLLLDEWADRSEDERSVQGSIIRTAPSTAKKDLLVVKEFQEAQTLSMILLASDFPSRPMGKLCGDGRMQELLVFSLPTIATVYRALTLRFKIIVLFSA